MEQGKNNYRVEPLQNPVAITYGQVTSRHVQAAKYASEHLCHMNCDQLVYDRSQNPPREMRRDEALLPTLYVDRSHMRRLSGPAGNATH